jgi:hypothetical protein
MYGLKPVPFTQNKVTAQVLRLELTARRSLPTIELLA